MEHKLLTLKNNLKTLFVQSEQATAGSVQIWFRTGSALEDENNKGIAHFLEHMFFKGTEKWPGSALTRAVESFGGEINAFTSFDYTCYYINCPNTHLLESITLLMDMVCNPLFKEDDLTPERNVVFEEFRRSEDTPAQYAFKALQKTAFTGKYNHYILGTEESIKSFTIQQLIDFRNRFYNVQNAMLVVAGECKDLNPFIQEIEQFNLPSGETTNYPEFLLKKKSVVDIHFKKTKMDLLSICFQAASVNGEDVVQAAKEDLAINSFGYGDSSRLYKKLVTDSAIANHATASTMYMNKGGAHFIKLSFPHENLDKVLKALSVMISDLIKNGFEKGEIEKIKNQYIASKIYQKETLESYSLSLGHSYAQANDIEFDEKFLEKIKMQNLDDVNEGLINIFANCPHVGLQIPEEIKSKVSKKDIAKKLNGFLKNINELAKQEVQKFSAISASSSSVKTKKIIKSQFDSKTNLIELSNGMKLIHRYNAMTPTFVLHTHIMGGVIEETDKTNGCYNLISSLLTSGYEKISSHKLKEIFDTKAASINGFSGKNAYGLGMHGLTEDFHFLMPHFIGSLTNPSMSKNDLKIEKDLSVRTLQNQEEDPVKKCFSEFVQFIFPNHPYSLNPIGTYQTLKKLERNELLKIHYNNLKDKKTIFTFCGNMKLEEVVSTLEKSIQEHNILKSISRKKKTAKKKHIDRTNLKISIKAKEGNKSIFFDREQTHIMIGFPVAPSGSTENIILKMITNFLSGQSSELFVDVRDTKGLCYSTQPIHFVGLEGSYWGIYMGSGHDKVKEAIDAILAIFSKYKSEGIGREDFIRIKKIIEGQNLINIQTNEDYANLYSVPTLHYDDLDYFHKTNITITELEYDLFQSILKTCFSRTPVIVKVGKDGVEI